MNSKIIFSAFSGLIIGLGCGILGTKTYYKNKYQETADKEINDMRDYYSSLNNYSFPESEIKEDVDPELYSKEALKERVEKKLQVTSYNEMYQSNEDSDIKNDTADTAADDFHEENKQKRPEIISVEMLGELPPNIDSQSLFLYKEDGIVTDDCDNVIDEPAYHIGRALDPVDLDDCDNPLFVLNYEIDVCYEIHLIDGTYPGYIPDLEK